MGRPKNSNPFYRLAIRPSPQAMDWLRESGNIALTVTRLVEAAALTELAKRAQSDRESDGR